MRVAALDLGSNTFILLIAEVSNRQIEKILVDETKVVRLSQGLAASGKISTEALARAETCFAEFSGLIKKFACENVIALATSAARDASNGQQFIDLGRKYNIPIKIISGEREAQVTYEGATYDLNLPLCAAVIDIGGGSTEIILTTGPGQTKGISLDIGSVRLTEMFITKHPCPAAEMVKLQSYIEEVLESEIFSTLPEIKLAVAVAGTPTTLAALSMRKPFNEKDVHRYQLSISDIASWRDKLASLSIEERVELPGMQANRADVLVAGSAILAAVCRKLRVGSVMVSTKGVRYGAALAWADFL